MATLSPYVPKMEYSVKLNGKASETGKGSVSFKDNYNSIAITYKCTNQSINRYQVWVTYTNDYPDDPVHGRDWGREVGVCALDNTESLSARTETTSTFLATNSIFTKGDGLYRLALCAKGDIDGSWDVTVIYFVVNTSTKNSEMIATADGSIFEVVDSDNEPSSIAGIAIAGISVVGDMEDTWQYPVVTDGNMTITQAYYASQDDTTLEVE